MFQAVGMMMLLASAASVQIAPKPVDAIEGQYIVSLRANISDADHESLVARFGGKKFKIGTTFRAMSVKLSEEQLAWVAQQEHLVELIEHNAVVRAAGPTAAACNSLQPATPTDPDPSWGQCRITTVTANDATYLQFAYNGTWGSGVDAYILDTGIQCDHPDFEGRCSFGANFVGGGNNDLNGHGTHCAGTVGARTWGIAKSVQLIAVKVLGDGGSGTWEGVIEGMEYVANQRAGSSRPAIASLSLGGGGHTAADNAANACQQANVNVVIAAGNSNADACNFSPARASLATAVGSTEITAVGEDQVDGRSSFSNIGTCVDIFAPGTQITSTWLNGGHHTISGTSMACPHVAGVLAVYLSFNPTATSAQAKSYVLNTALSTDIRNRGAGSPDRMAHVQC